MLRIEHTQGFRNEISAYNFVGAVLRRLNLAGGTFKIKIVKASGLVFPVVLSTSNEALLKEECFANNIAYSNKPWKDAQAYWTGEIA